MRLDVSGSNFLLNSDYVYNVNWQTVEPVEKIKHGEVVFAETHLIDGFFELIFPKLKIILPSQNISNFYSVIPS
jgi:hypothetical protein